MRAACPSIAGWLPAVAVAAVLGACGGDPPAGTPPVEREDAARAERAQRPRAAVDEAIAETPLAPAPNAPEAADPFAPRRTWAGRVVDIGGRGIEGARASASGVVATTGTDGAFRLEGLRPEYLELAVEAPGFTRWDWKSWPGREDLRIELRRSVRARGVVVHQDGTPAGGARVNHTVTAGPDGTFEVDLAEGSATLFTTWGVLSGCGPDDYATCGFTHVAVDPADPPHDIRVVLDESRSWVGARVLGTNGEPTNSANVFFRSPGRFRFGQGLGGDAFARMSLPVPPGTDIELRAVSTDRRSPAHAVVRTVSLPGRGEPVTIRLVADDPPPAAAEPAAPEPPLGALDLAVSDTRELIGGRADVWVAGSDGHTVTRDSLSPANSTRHYGLEPGRYLVEIRTGTDAQMRRWARWADVTSGATARLVCDRMPPPPIVAGRVLGPDGVPLGGVAIRAALLPRFRSRWTADTSTDASGWFALPVADTNEAWISAEREGFAPAFRAVNPRDGAVAEFHLSLGGTVTFHLTPADAWLDQEVDVSDQSGSLHWKGIAEREGGGAQWMQHVPPGRWRLKIGMCGAEREVVVEVCEGATTNVDLSED